MHQLLGNYAKEYTRGKQQKKVREHADDGEVPSSGTSKKRKTESATVDVSNSEPTSKVAAKGIRLGRGVATQGASLRELLVGTKAIKKIEVHREKEPTVSVQNPEAAAKGVAVGAAVATQHPPLGLDSGPRKYQRASNLDVKVGERRKKRARRADKATQAELYAALHARMPRPVTEEALLKEFSDKELRVLMTHNGMLINDYDQRTGSYKEKTKTSKCRLIIAAVSTMIVPKRNVDSLTNATTPTQWRKSTKGACTPRAQAVASGETESRRELIARTDVEEFLDRVKDTFKNTPEVYNDFLDVMKAVEREKINTAAVIDRVCHLLHGYQGLIRQFGKFLPAGHPINEAAMAERSARQARHHDAVEINDAVQALVGVTQIVPHRSVHESLARDNQRSHQPRPPLHDPPAWLMASFSSGGMQSQGH